MGGHRREVLDELLVLPCQDGDAEATLQERARAPERIRAVTPLLERAISEEVSGLDALKEAVNLLE